MSPSLSKVVVKAPATTANLGPGFDVFGMALEEPYDKVTLVPASNGTIRIEVNGAFSDLIPLDPGMNTAGVVAEQMIKEFSLETGVLIRIDKGIPPGVGLGSSAASAAAVAFGLNIMFNLNLENKQLVRLSAKGEVASAGFEHADNVSAAIYGGFVIIKSYEPPQIVPLKTPPNLGLCVAVPKVPPTPKKTEKARSILPTMVSMDKVRHNVGHAASLAVGFAVGDVKLIGGSMSDAIVEPVRASMIPGYSFVKDAALKAGACGVAISGAGPSIIAVIDENQTSPLDVAEAMKDGFKRAGLDAEVFPTRPGKGVSLLEAR
ncbi:MAG: homoserine kinase [Candidatus Bathyarchaeia archaeon]